MRRASGSLAAVFLVVVLAGAASRVAGQGCSYPTGYEINYTAGDVTISIVMNTTTGQPMFASTQDAGGSSSQEVIMDFDGGGSEPANVDYHEEWVDNSFDHGSSSGDTDLETAVSWVNIALFMCGEGLQQNLVGIGIAMRTVHPAGSDESIKSPSVALEMSRGFVSKSREVV